MLLHAQARTCLLLLYMVTPTSCRKVVRLNRTNLTSSCAYVMLHCSSMHSWITPQKRFQFGGQRGCGYWYETISVVFLAWKRPFWGGWSGCGWKNGVKMMLSTVIGIICWNWYHLHISHIMNSMIPCSDLPTMIWLWIWDATTPR